MKNNKRDIFIKELSSLSVEELNQKIDSLRKELFYLKIKSFNERIADCSLFGKLKKDIARALTVANSKRDSKSL